MLPLMNECTKKPYYFGKEIRKRKALKCLRRIIERRREMKFKKFKAAFLAFLLSCSVPLSGCTVPFLNSGQESEQPEDNEEENSENEESKTDDEVKSEQTDNETDADDESGWEADLNLPGISSTGNESVQEPTSPECICSVLCTSDTLNSECPVCTEDFHRCTGEKEDDPLDAIALPEGQTATASIAACGSNFFSQPVINGTDKSYKYDYIYDKMKGVLEPYDVKIVTQETVFTNDPSRYSGSNPYMSPPSIASALVNAGFNVISSASDHTFDNGKEGVLDTLNAWNSYASSTLVTGIYASSESYNNVSYMDVNGIRIAFLSYTSSLNGMTLTNEEKTYVKTLYDENTVAEDITYASKIADFVIILPHWGMEDSVSHTANQEKWAKVFIDNGADLIIGTGSDYLQDVVLYEGKNGQAVPCYYSLGNFVSEKASQEEVLSGAASITITKTGKETKLESYDMIPVALHVSKKGDYFQPYILSEYTEDVVKWHNLVQKGKPLTLEKLNEQYNNTVKIEDIGSSTQGSGGSSISIGQQQVTVTQPDAEQDNDGKPLVDNGNIPETSNPGSSGSENNGLGGLQVIGG